MPPVNFNININTTNTGPGGLPTPGGLPPALQALVNSQTLLNVHQVNLGSGRTPGTGFRGRLQDYAYDKLQSGMVNNVANATGSSTLANIAGIATRNSFANPGPITTGLSRLNIATSILTETIRKMDQVMLNLIHDIAPFSGVVSAAIANAHVARIFAMIRRSDALEGSSAQYVASRSEMEVALMDLKTTIMQHIVPHLANGAGAVAAAATDANNLVTMFTSEEGRGLFFGQLGETINVGWQNIFGTAADVEEAKKGVTRATQALENFFGGANRAAGANGSALNQEILKFFQFRQDPGDQFFTFPDAVTRFF
jgi:hypothetical protein